MKTSCQKPVRPAGKRLKAYSIGLWWQARPKRILHLAGWQLFRFGGGTPSGIAVWGRKRSARRGIKVAQSRKLPLITIEDAFLRSVQTGREGVPGLGIVADRTGISFDTGAPNDLMTLIGESDAMTAAEVGQARKELAKLLHRRLSKYNAFDTDISGLPSEFVLVLDQASKDASIALGGGSHTAFHRMLAAARAENPGATILIKTHPETIAGTRTGHFDPVYDDTKIVVWSRRTNPYVLFERARCVYCVTSQMGFEAMLAGHRPKIFGRPFFAGWGLSDDRNPDQRQHGHRSVLQIFSAAYLKYPIWYDPFSDQLCRIGRVMDNLQAQSKHWSVLHKGVVCVGFSRWKKPFARRYFKASAQSPVLTNDWQKALIIAREQRRDLAVWASKETPALRQACVARNQRLWRVEDGFIRSVGLGAAKVRPASLLLDDLGVHYDPSRPSRLEEMIAAATKLPEFEVDRARRIRNLIAQGGLSKYNLCHSTVPLVNAGGRQIVLVVGQVEDDASVVLGTRQIAKNTDLIRAARKQNPDAYLIYKPHPDVEAGYRRAADLGTAAGLVNLVAQNTNIGQMIALSDRVCTLTSLTGFEALLHGKPVTVFGAPFYAGWGLTDDFGDAVTRRLARPTLDQLVHAALIDYPLYWDPVTGAPCPVEVVLDRFGQAAQSPRIALSSRAVWPHWLRGSLLR